MRATWMPDRRACFIAGVQSVSLVARAIRSTERLDETFAMSIPIPMSTPFCSNSGWKSASVRGWPGVYGIRSLSISRSYYQCARSPRSEQLAARNASSGSNVRPPGCIQTLDPHQAFLQKTILTKLRIACEDLDITEEGGGPKK